MMVGSCIDARHAEAVPVLLLHVPTANVAIRKLAGCLPLRCSLRLVAADLTWRQRLACLWARGDPVQGVGQGVAVVEGGQRLHLRPRGGFVDDLHAVGTQVGYPDNPRR